VREGQREELVKRRKDALTVNQGQSRGMEIREGKEAGCIGPRVYANVRRYVPICSGRSMSKYARHGQGHKEAAALLGESIYLHLPVANCRDLLRVAHGAQEPSFVL
jgi:hypothetical protein